MDSEDVARIMCLYLCSTLFFFFVNTSHSLKWGFLKCIEDLKTVKDYAWSGAIRIALMTLIKFVVAPERVSGWVVLLPYIISYVSIPWWRKQKLVHKSQVSLNGT